MVEIRQDKPTARKITERLGNLPCGREPEATVTTYPTRTVTNTYPAGFQSQRGDQVRRGDGET
jgi:hypothetical protein